MKNLKLTRKENVPVYCAPGEQIDQKIVQQLAKINANRGQKKDLRWALYVSKLKVLFKCQAHCTPLKKKRIEKEFFILFAGFFLGEGSLNVSAKRNESSRFGIMLDPEFSVTQHVNGVSHLINALEIFKTGTIRYKSGSNATFVFRIDSRDSLLEKCIPFCEKFCMPYASKAWVERFLSFKCLLELFVAGEHLNQEGFLYKMLPIWDQLRKQRKCGFESLSRAQQYVRDFKKNKFKDL